MNIELGLLGEPLLLTLKEDSQSLRVVVRAIEGESVELAPINHPNSCCWRTTTGALKRNQDDHAIFSETPEATARRAQAEDIY